MIKEIQEEMEKRLGNRYELSCIQVEKVGGKKTGIQCRSLEDNKVLIVYPQDYETLLEDGIGTEEIAEHLAEKVIREKRDSFTLPLVKEELEDTLSLQLVNTEMNRGLLEHAVHESFADYSAIVRCVVFTDEDGMCSFIVTDENMGVFQMTKEEILERAYANAAGQEVYMENLNEVMRSEMQRQGMPQEMVDQMIPKEESPLYLLTNAEKMYGANLMACPDVLQGAYEKLQEPFYILPSSTHEVLLVKESAGFGTEELKNMVRSVNLKEVKAEDLLSFEVFRFDGKKLSIMQEETEKLEKKAKKVLHLR